MQAQLRAAPCRTRAPCRDRRARRAAPAPRARAARPRWSACCRAAAAGSSARAGAPASSQALRSSTYLGTGRTARPLMTGCRAQAAAYTQSFARIRAQCRATLVATRVLQRASPIGATSFPPLVNGCTGGSCHSAPEGDHFAGVQRPLLGSPMAPNPSLLGRPHHAWHGTGSGAHIPAALPVPCHA